MERRVCHRQGLRRDRPAEDLRILPQWVGRQAGRQATAAAAAAEHHIAQSCAHTPLAGMLLSLYPPAEKKKRSTADVLVSTNAHLPLPFCPFSVSLHVPPILSMNALWCRVFCAPHGGSGDLVNYLFEDIRIENALGSLVQLYLVINNRQRDAQSIT